MDYIEEMRKKNFQEFNSVSDYIDYDGRKKIYKNIKTIISAQDLNKITKKLKYDSNLYVFLGAFLFLLERYGRQNSIIIELNYNEKKLPIGVESKNNLCFKDFLEQLKKEINRYNKSSLTNNKDYANVSFYYNNHIKEKNGILSLEVVEKNENYEIKLMYAANYYEEENMRYFIRHYMNIIKNTLKNLNKSLDEIELTDSVELERINTIFNKEYKKNDSNKTITDVIEENAKKYNNKKAVIYDSQSISYAELNEKANILANRLISNKVGNGDYVVIIPERSIEMIIGILAILKSGAAYVPIDPKYPDDRIEYIIETCEPKVVLTSNRMLHLPKKIIHIDITKKDYIGNINNPVRNQNNDSIAYSIFTSGTTGKPKGVVLKHKGLYNLVFNYKEIYGITDKDTLLQFASIAFDQSVWDIFTILGLGGTLCLMPSELINDPRELEKYMEKNEVSIAALTPAYIKLLNPENLKSLKVIESGSAAADYENLKRWKKNRRVFNTYGPTEATVNTMSYEITTLDNRVLPIGKPIENVKIYIISNNHLCGIGEPGELCIAGYGLAKEYLKQPETTAKAFVDCPFEDGKMYRSGDLVKYRYDGQIICIGRIDDQIKIRGYRIELGEIENCIKEIEYIKDVCLVAETKSDGEKEIDAYVVSIQTVLPKNVKEYLSLKLPHYMVPAHIYQVDNMPLTINGKIDKQKLRSMPKTRVTECVPPKTTFEKDAIEVYKNVLGIDTLGVTDDFYEIGGSSIKAISIISNLREMGYTYQVCDLLRTKNIRDLGTVKVSSCSQTKYISLENKIYKEKIKECEKKLKAKAKNISYLTPTQMYMLEAYREHIVGDNYLQYFYNCPKDIDANVLEKAINILPIKNEALTTVIIDDMKKPYQIRFNKRKIEFEEIDNVSYDEYQEICKKDIIRGFDIEKDPMLRFKLFRLKDGKIKLLFSVSHIIVDGWSVELVIQDLSSLYERIKAKESLSSIKKEYSQTEKSLLEECLSIINGTETKEVIDYWNNYFKLVGKGKTIPYDEIKKEKGNWSIVDWIDEEETYKIKEFCKKTSVSENTLFELAYAYLLAISNNSKSSFFYKVISGRDLPVTNIDNIVGMIINIIPQSIKTTGNVVKNLQKLNNILLENSKYDKYDFYHKKVNNKLLMNEGNTIFVFSNYYELTNSIFEYEFDRDQDEVDMSFFVDSMQKKYHILITCQKSLYSMNRLKNICRLYRDILIAIISEGNLNDLHL